MASVEGEAGGKGGGGQSAGSFAAGEAVDGGAGAVGCAVWVGAGRAA
jgi:hypothetical protein